MSELGNVYGGGDGSPAFNEHDAPEGRQGVAIDPIDPFDYTFKVSGELILRHPDDFDAGGITADEAVQDALSKAGLRFAVDEVEVLGSRPVSGETGSG